MKNYIRVKEMLKELGVSRATLYRLIDKGLPVVKIGGSTRFDVEAVQQWIEDQNKGAE